jgi:ATP-dependent DNA helicase RecG
MAAAYLAAKNGWQTAFLAPTEVLARQHFTGFGPWLAQLGTPAAFLAGGLASREKNQARAAVAAGEVSIVIGTHALLQESVRFHKLGLVITDEQHRFGVRQRGALRAKGEGEGLCPHMAVMSATPIPRTLALILYGDMAVSVLDQVPPGRQPVATYAVTAAYRPRLYRFIRRQLEEGRQAYIICPAVEAGPLALESVAAYAEKIRPIFPENTLAALHGKMPPAQKEEIMTAFAQGAVRLLVATTVVEVGINVPNATVMVVENAERFGLAQLHQLRGRVGRGAAQSYCVLITDSDSEICARRMQALKVSGDGFALSELDLQLRGPGDFFGEQQHGLPAPRVPFDLPLLQTAQAAAQAVHASPQPGDAPLGEALRAYTEGKLLL